MHIFAVICFAGAFLAAVFAVVYQRSDMTPNHASTMGGQMTAGAIWSLVSLLCAAGSLAFVRWYFSVIIFVAVYALSFLARVLVDRIPKRSV